MNEVEVLVFSSATCEPCKWLEPILEEVKQKADPSWRFTKLAIEDHEQLVEDFVIGSVPTMVVLKNKEEQGRYRGIMYAKDLEAWIAKLAS